MQHKFDYLPLETVPDVSHVELAESKVTIPITSEVEKSMVLDENQNDTLLMGLIDGLFDHDTIMDENLKSPGKSIEAIAIDCEYQVHQIDKLCQSTATKMLLKTGEEATVHHIKSGRNGRFTVNYQFASKLL